MAWLPGLRASSPPVPYLPYNLGGSPYLSGPQVLTYKMGGDRGLLSLSFSITPHAPHSFLRASRPSTMTYESLKPSLQADRLCLMNHHLSLHPRSPHSSPRAPATVPRGPRPEGLKAREVETWEGPPGLRSLPGALVDTRDPRLEGALHVLLAQQLRARGQASGARLRGTPRLREAPPSPPVGSDSEGPEGKAAGAALPGGQHPQTTGPGSPGGKEGTATQHHAPDKPLDLSEWGRARDTPKPSGQPRSLSPKTAHTPSPEPPQGAGPPAQSGPWERSNGTKGAGASELEDPPTPEVRLSPVFAPDDPTQASTHLSPLRHQPVPREKAWLPDDTRQHA